MNRRWLNRRWLNRRCWRRHGSGIVDHHLVCALVYIGLIHVPCSVIQSIEWNAGFSRALRFMVAFDVFVVLRQGSFVCPIVCNEKRGILTAYCLIAQYPPAHLCFSLYHYFFCGQRCGYTSQKGRLSPVLTTIGCIHSGSTLLRGGRKWSSE